jgi:AraC-like DNA-binding protein
MTPGSILLGNSGQHFECGHEHASGDRCISFHYAPDYFEQIAADTGAGRSDRTFRVLRLPALRDASLLISRAAARLGSDFDSAIEWGELGVEIAAAAVGLASGAAPRDLPDLPSTTARVTRAVRLIEDHLKSEHPTELSLATLAREASLSPYHFLRTFERITGVTPHQYVRRSRLRLAAARLAAGDAKVLDIALDCGFGDVSNFNRSFRSEFGMSPRVFRKGNFSLHRFYRAGSK